MTAIVFGRFLELSIPTPDIQDSLNFYSRLGFSGLPVGDIRNYHYGVVTDGRIAIGLHAGGIEEPSLSFVHPDVAAYLQRVMPADEELLFSRLGNETFNEIGVRTPDEHQLVMMEARTFSRAYLAELPIPFTGQCVEISLGCGDLVSASRYWIDAGFVANTDTLEEPPGDLIEVLAPGLRLGLRATLKPGQMALRLAPGDLEQALDRLAQCNISVQRTSAGHCVTAPEGTRLDLVPAGDNVT